MTALNPLTAPKETADKTYQHYTSSRISMRLITHNGKKINFTKYAYITDNTEIMEYLDSEIDFGLKVITKGQRLSHAEADPMEALKRKHIADYIKEEKEKKAALAKGELKDMGNTKAAGSKNVNPASSKTVAS